MILDIEAPTSPDARARLLTLMPLLKERARTHLDIVDGAGYLLHGGTVPIVEEAASLLDDAAKVHLLQLDQYLQGGVWGVSELKPAVDEFMAENNLKMRDIGLPLRAALTGSKQSPSIIDIMAALGATETSRRIRSACDS